MWADNETDIDLLGFQVHTDLLRSVVTDTSLLPITIGVFGDWGSGKSSVMKMLERDLDGNDQIATIYFNGWQFEGYDDAKSALIYSILIELAEHRRVSAEIRTRVKGLIKKIDWLRLASTGYQIAAPFLAAWLAAETNVPVMPPVIPQPQSPIPPLDEAQEQLVEDIADIDLSELLRKNPANQAMVGVRQFRNDFEKLIADTNLDAVVILVDDLDRCEPKRLVDTLEAIKLFLTVPHVAFVIGADERIVRYAISKRYETEDVTQDAPIANRQTDLVTDYIEKLIQIPYYLPRLSQSEIETYMCLLFCKQSLGEHFPIIHKAYVHSRSQDITRTFDLEQIQLAANEAEVEIPGKLIEEINWCSVIAPTLSDFLKGNPRQTKRLLNTLVLRRKLAEAAQLENVSDQILVKLILLEYLRPRLFAQLYKWQASQVGISQEIANLEEWASSDLPEIPDGIQERIEQSQNWNNPSIRGWLTMRPSLSGEDLRNYFWITRDRVTGILSGVSTVPRYIRQIILNLTEMDPDGIFPEELRRQISQFSPEEQNILLDELEEKTRRAEDKRDLILIWHNISRVAPLAMHRLFDFLERTRPESLPNAFPMRVTTIGQDYPEFREKAIGLLRHWSQDNQTPFGRAAQEALKRLE